MTDKPFLKYDIPAPLYPTENGTEHMEPSDIMRQEIIEMLLDRGEFLIDYVNEKYHVEIRRMMLREFRLLKEMQDDGVVKLDDPLVRVTAAGRPYLRVVCRVFDTFGRSEDFPAGFFK